MTRKERGGIIMLWIGFGALVLLSLVALGTKWPFVAWVTAGAAVVVYYQIEKVKCIQAGWKGDEDDEG